MARKLTAAAVTKLRPRNERYEVLDGGCPNLYVVVEPSGRKAWVARYRLSKSRGGRNVKQHIGRVEDPPQLAAARKAARDIVDAARRGEDPRRRNHGISFGDAFERWMAEDQAGHRSVKEVRRAVEKKVLGEWRDRPLAEIDRGDCRELLKRVARDGAPTTARRLHSHLHRMFRWAVGEDLVAMNAMADLPKLGAENPRDRVLSDAELSLVWRASADLGWPFGPVVQMLILTAARRDEIVSLQWKEVDLDEGQSAISLPRERTKNGQPRIIPLSAVAAGILRSVPRLVAGGSELSPIVFTTTGMTPASGVSRAKRRLDELVAKQAAKDGDKYNRIPIEVSPWRLHDIRRTVATALQRQGERLEVIEAVLGHVGGSRAGIVGVYQRHAFEDEKQAALEAWAEEVLSIARV